MPRSELAPDSSSFLGVKLHETKLFFRPDEETVMAITESDVDNHEALFWTAPDGFQFPILINLTEGNDGTWRL